jgi:hypothetical protein
MISTGTCRVLALVATVCGTMAAPSPGLAQGKLDARYTVSLAGVQIGRGAWAIEIADDHYTAALSGVASGLLRFFSKGEGTGAVRGIVTEGRLVPMGYMARIASDKRSEEVSFNLDSGTVKDLAIVPEPVVNPERVPVTEAHLRGVIDPMTSALVRVGGTNESVGPEACAHGASVFDGRLRYDLTMSFKRIENVKADKGYRGPVAVCGVYFTPVAGYIPGRPAIKHLTEQKDMEIWLAPIIGTRVVVPYRFSLPTPLGQGVLQATSFQSEAVPHLIPTSAPAR